MPKEIPHDQSTNGIIKKLTRCDHLSSGMSRDDILKLVETSKIIKFEDGEYLIREGEHGDRIFILLDGVIKIVKRGCNEDLATLDEPGAVIGEMGVIDGGQRSASVQAMGKVYCLEVDGSRLEGNHGLSSVLLVVLAQRLRDINRRLVEANQEAGFHEKTSQKKDEKIALLEQQLAEKQELLTFQREFLNELLAHTKTSTHPHATHIQKRIEKLTEHPLYSQIN